MKKQDTECCQNCKYYTEAKQQCNFITIDPDSIFLYAGMLISPESWCNRFQKRRTEK